MTKFRPCIDLHEGRVKQIVGGSLTEQGAVENFVSEQPAGYYAELFGRDGLTGGHVIQLGPGNAEAAREALQAYPNGLQLGGGVKLENAASWLQAGASAVIVTSMLFDADGCFQLQSLKELSEEVGVEHLIIDLSCRRVEEGWQVAMNRWQTLTDLPVTTAVLEDLAEWGAEFLIHAADVEGKCGGIDEELVALLGSWSGRPITYAGGVGKMADVELVESASGGKVDVTVGSALDIFGGDGVRYEELLRWNERGMDS